MIEGKTILAIIPARGGSKGVPRKNIKDAAGKPLIAWTIKEAKKSKFIDRLVVSTEDDEIVAVAKSWGCEVPFVRPPELAQDDTPGVEPVLHAIKMLPGYDYVVLLQPTSPLRNTEDIDGCIEECVEHGANSCVSVAEVEQSPYWMYTLDVNSRLCSLINTDQIFTRRQDLPKVFTLNGAVYVAKCDWLRKNRTFLTAETAVYLMPRERSLDIDSELDFVLLAALRGENDFEK